MTFSIIGFDPLKNRFGVAVSSCHIAVGSTVSFVRSQVGAVATQGQTNPYLGLRSLESLQSCSDSKIVLEDLIKEDFGREKRQVHLIDKYGRSACWTGQECFQTSGHISGENFSVAGNFLENIEVQLSVEVGNTEIKIRDLLRLNEGSVIELDRLAGDPLDILVNGTMIAKGEIVMVGERFGVRFTEIVDPEKRVESL